MLHYGQKQKKNVFHFLQQPLTDLCRCIHAQIINLLVYNYYEFDIDLKNQFFFLLFNLFLLLFINFIILFDIIYEILIYYFNYFLTLSTILLVKNFHFQLNKLFPNRHLIPSLVENFEGYSYSCIQIQWYMILYINLYSVLNFNINFATIL